MAELPFSKSSAAIGHLNRGFERLAQLLALLSSTPADQSITAPAIFLVDKAMFSIGAALSELQSSSSHHKDSAPTAAEDGGNGADSKKRGMKRVQSWTIVTSVPHFDGHQWRKYGQKRIHSSEFPRSYFKCTHSKERGCQATKTVQQKEDKISNPLKYVVRYTMQHTCKARKTHENPIVMDSSAILNEHSISSSKAASSDHSPALHLQGEDIELVSLMESSEPHGEANLVEGLNQMSTFAEFDFDWEWLVS